MAKKLTKKQKAELKKKKALEAKKATPPVQKTPTPPEPPVAPGAEKTGKIITCNRCQLKYKSEEAVIMDEKKCCPECNAPQEWLS